MDPQEKYKFKEEFRDFLTISIKNHSLQRQESFDVHTMTPKQIDSLLEERKVWLFLDTLAKDKEETPRLYPVLSYMAERLEVINSILKRLAN